MIVTATHADIPDIQDIAEKTWWPTYLPIVGEVQLRFMLDTIYSTAALKTIMRPGGQEFILIKSENKTEGFAAFSPRPEDATIYKLQKLYVLPGNHGKGSGRQLLQEVIRRTAAKGIKQIDLNVNRQNPAVKFYEKAGFKIVREEDVAIGPYWMNDYVMTLFV